MPVHNNLPFFFNEATEMRESNLHPLVDNLSDRHQVFRDMQQVDEFSFLPHVAKGNFTDMFNGMRSVVANLDHSFIFRFLQV